MTASKPSIFDSVCSCVRILVCLRGSPSRTRREPYRALLRRFSRSVHPTNLSWCHSCAARVTTSRIDPPFRMKPVVSSTRDRPRIAGPPNTEISGEAPFPPCLVRFISLFGGSPPSWKEALSPVRLQLLFEGIAQLRYVQLNSLIVILELFVTDQ